MIDWDKPIEWDNGEPSSLVSPYRDTLCPVVEACAAWTKHTGEREVHVDAKHGGILGCESDYPRIRNRKPPASFAGPSTPES